LTCQRLVGWLPTQIIGDFINAIDPEPTQGNRTFDHLDWIMIKVRRSKDLPLEMHKKFSRLCTHV
jgi:hypothetical protein